MKNKIKLLFILLISSSFFVHSCEEKAKDIDDPGWGNGDGKTKRITVMTYNVKYCSGYNTSVVDLNAIAEVIKSAKPDIVFFQELDRNTTRSGKVDQLAELSKKTRLPFTFYGKAIDYQGGESGVAIMSRYSLSNTKRTDLPRVDLGPNVYVSYRILVQAEITVNDKKLTVVASHLELTQENRDVQIPVINEILSKSTYPVIFAGDFNATPDNKTITSLIGYGFKKTCTQGCLTITSMNPAREIDYIMYRPEKAFKVISHIVPSTLASDHLPVVAVLEIQD